MAASTSKPTPIPSDAPNLPAWLTPRRLTIAGGVVAILLIVGYVVVMSGRRKERFSERALDQARSTAEAGQLPQAATQFQQVIQSYRGTDAAKEATLGLNQIRLINNQNELAVVNLREFLQSNPGREFEVPGNGLLGVALENSGQPAEAAAAYQKASDLADVNYLKADYLIQAGRAWRDAGKKDQAIQAYEAVVQKYGDTPAATEAKVRLAELTDGQRPLVTH
ncbi:MAG TPA: tetratricopeptide repeat protein [Gemmatimonadales bacterium]|nr:tetratricopeptide repeat protein [Gemmatimonadales bacterium]